MDKWLQWADVVDRWRVVPRLLVMLYGCICYDAYMWFTTLASPTGVQVTFVSTIWGGAALWFNFYVNSGGHRHDP